MFMFIWSSFFLTGVMSDLETTKSEDVRQCALCQQYGDSAPCVSSAVLQCSYCKGCKLIHIFIINKSADYFFSLAFLKLLKR